LERVSSCPIYFTLSSSGGTVTPQVRVAGADGVYGDWQILSNGQNYIGKQFDSRLLLQSSGTVVKVIEFNFTVDVPDAIDKGMVLVPVEGADITFKRPFKAEPGISATILNATVNDDLVITNLTKTGFNIKLKNGSIPVSKNASWIAVGYY
jgi:hypothetical protein